MASATVDLHDLRLLGRKADLAFYVARSVRAGERCFVIGGNDGSALGLEAVSCSRSDSFPSPDNPINDLSVRFSSGGSDANSIVTRLVGYAADDVRTIGLVAIDGSVFFRTPVVGNVYSNNTVPPVPVRAIVALDAAGQVLYSISD